MSVADLPVVVLVDGSNVVHAESWRRLLAGGDGDDATPAGDEQSRRRLVDLLGSWSAAAGHELLVVFDGRGPWQLGLVQLAPGIAVEASGERSGDAVLERTASRLGREGRRFWLASDDGAVRRAGGPRAERVLGCAQLADEVVAGAAGRTTNTDGQHDVPGSAEGASRLHDTLDPATRSALERLRRGT